MLLLYLIGSWGKINIVMIGVVTNCPVSVHEAQSFVYNNAV